MKEKVFAKIKELCRRYFVEAMSAMALGLFSSLIVGLILSQIGKIPGLGFLAEISEIVSAKSPVVGAAIGAAVAWGLKAKPLVIFSSAVTGAFGYSIGGPVGAYVGSLVGVEIAKFVSGKTKVDIIVSPVVTIIAGCIAGKIIGAPVNGFMSWFGGIINSATELSPVPMGIIVSVLVGLALTAPISSAAICIMLDLSGIAAGAAAVGCCCQMVGFAVASYKDNGVGGLVSQGLGTSMLQFGNIMRRPQIWIAPTLASAVLGPVSTAVLHMTNTASGAGMGTSGLVGQFGAYDAMGSSMNPVLFIVEILIMHFILPAVLTLVFHFILRHFKIVKDGDMKLDLAK